MSCSTIALSATEIRENLSRLPHWQFRENALERVYAAPTYLDGLEQLNAVARLSEQADHHPDLFLGWRKLTVRYWTHTANGVTQLDFELAQRVEDLLTGK